MMDTQNPPTWTRVRLEQDLDELKGLLKKAKAQSRGTVDDDIAQRLISQLIRRRRDQLRRIL